MTFSIVLFLSSFGAIVFWITRGFDRIKDMTEKEFLSNLQASMPVSSEMRERLVIPIINFYHNAILPWFYKETEKAISKFRINVLRIESQLLKLANYIRGKRKICLDENSSKYWKEMNEYKSEFNKVK